MSTTYLKKLYACVPGFKHDKDEEWTNYLSQEEQTFVRKCREKFIIMKDKLDELKLEQKDHGPTTPEYTGIGRKITEDTRRIDEHINSILMIKLPQLRKKALKTREKLIEDDFAQQRQQAGQSSAEPVFGGEFAAMASSFDAYLPMHMLPAYESPEREPEPEPEPRTTTAAAATQRVQRREVVRDTYLDGVERENVAIMNKMRPLVEKFDCRDRVLDTLKAIRHRDSSLNILEKIKDFASQRSSAVVPMDT